MKYSLEEIDAMRSDLRRLIYSQQPIGVLIYSNDAADDRRVEDMLRTYMQNGTAPDELKTYVDKRARENNEARQRDYDQQSDARSSMAVYGGRSRQ